MSSILTERMKGLKGCGKQYLSEIQVLTGDIIVREQLIVRLLCTEQFSPCKSYMVDLLQRNREIIKLGKIKSQGEFINNWRKMVSKMVVKSEELNADLLKLTVIPSCSLSSTQVLDSSNSVPETPPPAYKDLYN